MVHLVVEWPPLRNTAGEIWAILRKKGRNWRFLLKFKKWVHKASLVRFSIVSCTFLISTDWGDVATFFNRFYMLWISQDPFPFCYKIEQGWLPISEAVLKSLWVFHAFWSENLLGTSAVNFSPLRQKLLKTLQNGAS